jgi:hypothetical protein
MEADISRVSITLEIQDQYYILAMSQDKLVLLMQLAVGLCDDGKLPLVKAPEGYHFESYHG